MTRSRLFFVVFAGLGLHGYALACTCLQPLPTEDNAHVQVRLKGGCLGNSAVVEAVSHDRKGAFAVGDTFDVRFKRGSDSVCGVDYGSGDVLMLQTSVPFDEPVAINACNSW